MLTNNILQLLSQELDKLSNILGNKICNDIEIPYNEEIWNVLHGYEKDENDGDDRCNLFKISSRTGNIIGYDWAIPLALKWYLERNAT